MAPSTSASPTSCGGEGNIAGARTAIGRAAAAHPELAGWDGPLRVAPGHGGPAARGGVHRRLDLAVGGARRPDDLGAYVATVPLGSHLERLPEDRRAAFAADVVAAMPAPEIDYVRLNILARA